MNHPVQTLISVPPAALVAERVANGDAFAASDPPGHQLGSGGGTVHLLCAAWKASGIPSFREWLSSGRKLIVHGSGQSRRLPAYAAEGKLMLPLPRSPAIAAQRPDETLLDLQRVEYERVFRYAPEAYRVMIACGDTIVQPGSTLPVFPDADVLIAGLPADPEEACNHGVMFSRTDGSLAFLLQKPEARRIRELAARYTPLLDTGIWLLTEKAVEALFLKCGWNPATETFANGDITPYELYMSFGLSLGSDPVVWDNAVSSLRSAVLPLPGGHFYHFGTNRCIFESMDELVESSCGNKVPLPSAAPVVLHASSDASIAKGARRIWIESSDLSASWSLGGDNVVTGVPANDWAIRLPRGACVDIAPVTDSTGIVLRVYGFDDTFKGAIGDPRTRWLGAPAANWFSERGLSLADIGVKDDADIQRVPLFPVVSLAEAGGLLQWMATAPTADASGLRDRWLKARRLAGADLLRLLDVKSRSKRRAERIRRDFLEMADQGWTPDPSLDLEQCAGIFAAAKVPPPEARDAKGLAGIHHAMFRARAERKPEKEAEAFRLLRDLMTSGDELRQSRPHRAVHEDQMVLGSSPARLDLAGGWSDTPPYCLEHGGRVLNVAVNLNGRAPVQVFARICKEPVLTIRSIDLGIREQIDSYEELSKPSALGGFSVARAALRLAGFTPEFHADGGRSSLREQLEKDFGGGLELSLLAAIPKGSGLGISSILSGTLLGVLGEICGLEWTLDDLFLRTSAIEQLLTSGGGWQDQVGGLAPGLKLVTTMPGLDQTPTIRHLPHDLLDSAARDGRALLYYTGITRVARNILSEIVRGIFLNDRSRVSVIGDIADNTRFLEGAISRGDWPAFQEGIRRSWILNKTLDADTDPPAVQGILDRIAPWRPAAKLLGAGGGGYLLLLADDPASGAAIRNELLRSPLNSRARFVNFSVSDQGLNVARS